MSQKLKHFLKAFFILILILTVYSAGFLHGRFSLTSGNFSERVKNAAIGQPKDADFSLFWQVWNQVNQDYVNSSNPQEMMYGSIAGMVASLGDPYSTFLNPQEAANFSQDLSGEFQGIGAELTQQDNKLIVVAPLDASPAQKAGLLPKDEITKIDTVDVSTLSFQEAINKIRGNEGTTVTLTVVRAGLDQPKDIKITRENIKVASAELTYKDDIAYIKVRQFGDDTVDLMKNIATQINEKKPKGIILDLRNNPGGYLTGSIDVSSLFIENSTIVSEQYKNGKKEEFKTTLSASLKDYKLVVLINEGSASASEIVAGAIQDTKKGVILGEKSFGKGSVQNYEQFQDKSALRLTVAHWLTPKGREINGKGITPDVVVARTDADVSAGTDPQLDAAITQINK